MPLTHVGEQKIFEISQDLSAILLVSGNGRFNGQPIKNFIDKYVSETDFNEISTVEDIKNSLNKIISKTTTQTSIGEYVENAFRDFEIDIKKSIIPNDVNQSVKYLKLNSFNDDIDFLNDNKLLNHNLTKLTNSLFEGIDKNQFDKIKFLLKRNFFNYICNNSPNFVLIGYDKTKENPTYIHYVILENIEGKLEFIVRYAVHNCQSTMIFTIAQDQEINLSLTSFNDNSFHDIQDIFHELLIECGNITDLNQDILNSIDEKLRIKINEVKLENLKTTISNIEFFPDSEILKLLDVLIELTAIKMKFSSMIPSVGGKRIKVVFRKYDGIKFME